MCNNNEQQGVWSIINRNDVIVENNYVNFVIITCLKTLIMILMYFVGIIKNILIFIKKNTLFYLVEKG